MTTARCVAIAALLLLVLSVDAGAQSPPSVSITPAHRSLWDVAAYGGRQGVNKSEIGPGWDNWCDSASFAASVGFYWTPHLKIEVDAGRSAQADFYSVESVSVPDLPYPYNRSRRHRFATTTSSRPEPSHSWPSTRDPITPACSLFPDHAGPVAPPLDDVAGNVLLPEILRVPRIVQIQAPIDDPPDVRIAIGRVPPADRIGAVSAQIAARSARALRRSGRDAPRTRTSIPRRSSGTQPPSSPCGLPARPIQHAIVAPQCELPPRRVDDGPVHGPRGGAHRGDEHERRKPT
jgi:hypothetical protein